MNGDPLARARRDQRRDLVWWTGGTAVGLAVTVLAVHSGAQLDTAAAPFLGRYRPLLSPAQLLAPALAAGVLVAYRTGWPERARFRTLLLAGYATALAWTLALATAGRPGGISRSTGDLADYLSDINRMGDGPLGLLDGYLAAERSPAARGHPPGGVLLLWLLHRAGLTDRLTLGLLVAAVGALTVPLVASAVRSVCGETEARRYLPVLALAPYAVWVAVSMDAVAATLGAAAVAAGIRASAPVRRGPPAAAWATASGALLGVAALFAYSVAWLGLTVACLYFARRRPLLNLATGTGALLPLLAANLAGFGWLAGLNAARTDFADRVGAQRPLLWWTVLSLATLLLAAGPALVASARKVRNTPGWPFLVGVAAAVTFSVLAGLARGGVEHAWLPFFPWLTSAAVAPVRPAGAPAPAPLLLVAVGALTAVTIHCVLETG